MDKLVFLVFLLVGVVTLTWAHTLADLHYGEPVLYKRTDHAGKDYYAGVYKGVCYLDGVYYGSEASLVFCTNGRPVYMDCADGTRNNDLNNYIYGNYYGYDDFCNVNLLNELNAN